MYPLHAYLFVASQSLRYCLYGSNVCRVHASVCAIDSARKLKLQVDMYMATVHQKLVYLCVIYKYCIIIIIIYVHAFYSRLVRLPTTPLISYPMHISHVVITKFSFHCFNCHDHMPIHYNFLRWQKYTRIRKIQYYTWSKQLFPCNIINTIIVSRNSINVWRCKDVWRRSLWLTAKNAVYNIQDLLMYVLS